MIQVYYVIGPNIPNDIEKLAAAYQQQDLQLTAYGDGTNQVDLAKLEIEEDSRIIIFAHGNHNGYRHIINLYSSIYESGSDYTSYHFQALGKETQGKPIELIPDYDYQSIITKDKKPYADIFEFCSDIIVGFVI